MVAQQITFVPALEKYQDNSKLTEFGKKFATTL